MSYSRPKTGIVWVTFSVVPLLKRQGHPSVHTGKVNKVSYFHKNYIGEKSLCN